jgi:TIR domain-containing protein
MAETIRIFVSHSHANNVWCRAFVQGLRAHGANVWYDEQNLGFGVLRQQIDREMLARPIFIAIFSADAAKSKWVNREIDGAISLQDREPHRIVLPILAEACEIPPLLSGFRWVCGPQNSPVTADEAVRLVAAALHLDDAFGYADQAISLVSSPVASVAPVAESSASDGELGEVDDHDPELLPLNYRPLEHAITDLYDEDRHTSAVRFPRILVAILLLLGTLALLFTGVFGYEGVSSGEPAWTRTTFHQPWLLYIWLVLLMMTLQGAILRSPSLRRYLVSSLVVTALAATAVNLISETLNPQLVRALLPANNLSRAFFSTSSTYAVFNFGLILLYWINSFRRWVRVARGLPAHPEVDIGLQLGSEPGSERHSDDTPSLIEVVSGDLIVGAAFVAFLALIVNVLTVRLLISLVGSPVVVRPCTVAWPLGSCFDAGSGAASAPSLSLLDLIQALVYLPLGLLIIALSMIIVGVLGQPAQQQQYARGWSAYWKSLMAALRSGLDRRFRMVFVLSFSSLRDLSWPLMTLIAVIAVKEAAYTTLAALHTAGAVASIFPTDSKYVSSAVKSIIWMVTAGCFAIVSAALLVFRVRVVTNSLRFLRMVSWQVLLVLWIGAVLLALFNGVLIVSGVVRHAPFLMFHPIAIVSLVCAFLVGQLFVVGRIRAFYRA